MITLVPVMKKATSLIVSVAMLCMAGSCAAPGSPQKDSDGCACYVINGDDVAERDFNEIMKSLKVDESSVRHYESRRGGVTEYIARDERGVVYRYMVEYSSEGSTCRLVAGPR